MSHDYMPIGEALSLSHQQSQTAIAFDFYQVILVSSILLKKNFEFLRKLRTSR
jgi:hypothetical protein